MITFVKYGSPCFYFRYLIAVSSTTINNKGANASPSLKPTLIIYSENKCLPILTLQYISLFKIQKKFTSFLGKPSICISLRGKCCLEINK